MTTTKNEKTELQEGVNAALAELERRGVPVYQITRGIMGEVAGYDMHRGLLVSADKPEPLSVAEVLDGARQTIARDRPGLLLELLSGTHADPGSYAKDICESFGYDAFVVQHGQKLPGLPTIAALGKNTSWGTEIETRNVLFLPR